LKILGILGIIFLGMNCVACSTVEGTYVETSAGYMLNLLFKKDGRNVTEGTLVETSGGYRADDPATYHLKTIRPDWITQPPSDDNDMVYLVGSSVPQVSSLEQENKTGWSVGEAGDEAWLDVQKQVSVLIENQINTDYQEKITGVRKSASYSSNKERKDKIQEYEENRTSEEAILQSWSRSSSSFQGLQRLQIYYERYEGRTREQDRIEYIQYWVLCSIPHVKIEEAREEIRKRESIEEKERRYFERLKEQYEEIKDVFKILDFSMHEPEYMQKYTNLVDINARLQGLALFIDPTSSIDASTREAYSAVVEQISDDMRAYDPTDKQRQGYESRIRILNNELERVYNLLVQREREVQELKSNGGGVIERLEKELELKNITIRLLEQQKNVDESLLRQYNDMILADIEILMASDPTKFRRGNTLPNKESLQQ
jgi:hypothetical protein